MAFLLGTAFVKFYVALSNFPIISQALNFYCKLHVYVLNSRISSSWGHGLVCDLRLLTFTCLPINTYCKFANFHENFIFVNNVKKHAFYIKNLRLMHDLPTSVNDREI